MMSSTLAVQTNGRGSLFQAVRYSSIALTKSGTLRYTPRRIACSLSSRTVRKSLPLPVFGRPYYRRAGGRRGRHVGYPEEEAYGVSGGGGVDRCVILSREATPSMRLASKGSSDSSMTAATSKVTSSPCREK